MKNRENKIREMADKVIVVKSDNDIPFAKGSINYRIVMAKLNLCGYADINIDDVKTFFKTE